MKRLFITACAIILAATLAQPAAAQVQFGAQLNWGDAADLGIGARAQFDLGGMIGSDNDVLSSLKGVVSADYFFQDCPSGVSCTYIEINGNGLYPLEMEGSQLAPYVGGGLNIAYGSVDISGFGSSSNTDVGLNILGGANFALASFDAFGEARLELGGGEQFVLSFGILFGGGG